MISSEYDEMQSNVSYPAGAMADADLYDCAGPTSPSGLCYNTWNPGGVSTPPPGPFSSGAITEDTVVTYTGPGTPASSMWVQSNIDTLAEGVSADAVVTSGAMHFQTAAPPL